MSRGPCHKYVWSKEGHTKFTAKAHGNDIIPCSYSMCALSLPKIFLFPAHSILYQHWKIAGQDHTIGWVWIKTWRLPPWVVGWHFCLLMNCCQTFHMSFSLSSCFCFYYYFICCSLYPHQPRWTLLNVGSILVEHHPSARYWNHSPLLFVKNHNSSCLLSWDIIAVTFRRCCMIRKPCLCLFPAASSSSSSLE